MSLFSRRAVNGRYITLKQLDALRSSLAEVGLDPGRYLYVTQGSWSNGGLSAGTHSRSGAVDVRLRIIPAHLWTAFNTAMRKRGQAAWLRTVRYGWTKGDHMHAIDLDDPYVSRGAKQQQEAYLDGRDGLAGNGRDPHPRPVMWPKVRMTGIKLRPEDVKRVQRALNRYLGINLLIDGKWGPKTSAAWMRAVVKSGRKGVGLLSLLGHFHGQFRPAE